MNICECGCNKDLTVNVKCPICPGVSESTGTAGCASLLADYKKLRAAAECIRHWHDRDNGGMVVSGEHVRELWKTLKETQEA